MAKAGRPRPVTVATLAGRSGSARKPRTSKPGPSISSSPMSIGAHNLGAVPIIILAIIVGVVIYLIRKRRSNPPNGS
jgi:hypothetical protein